MGLPRCTMNEPFYINLDNSLPLIAAAIHNGYLPCEKAEHISALISLEWLREEDPYTGEWTKISMNRFIANFSRFEVDLNRSRNNINHELKIKTKEVA